MNKYKTNRGRVAFVTLAFGIIAMLMIVSANNRTVELTYESPYEESKEVVLDDRAEAYIAEAIEAIDVIIEETENAEELAANSSPVEEKEDGLDSDEDSNDTKFTADEEDEVYSAVLGSND